MSITIYLRFVLIIPTITLTGVLAWSQGLPDKQSLPKLPAPRQLLLDVDLRIDSGATSTATRAVTLDFTALEKGDGNITVANMTSRITHYRALEDSSNEALSQQPWLEITRRPPFFNLAERNKDQQRYGE